MAHAYPPRGTVMMKRSLAYVPIFNITAWLVSSLFYISLFIFVVYDKLKCELRIKLVTDYSRFSLCSAVLSLSIDSIERRR